MRLVRHFSNSVLLKRSWLYSIDIVFVLNKRPILSFPASTARQIAHSALIDNQNANGNGFLIFLYIYMYGNSCIRRSWTARHRRAALVLFFCT
jgi:hypothetical protein